MDYDDNEDYKKTWCYCGQPSYGQMIHCDHESCSIEWFHCHCLRIRKIPKGTEIFKLPEATKKGKKTKKINHHYGLSYIIYHNQIPAVITNVNPSYDHLSKFSLITYF